LLIIFDLDDTLIETSKCLTPRRLEDALRSMIRAGLAIQTFDAAFQRLNLLNTELLSARAALDAFASSVPGGASFLTYGLDVLSRPLQPDEILTVHEGAVELIQELKKRHSLALVSIGKPALQMQKLEKAGIQPQVFSKLVVGEGASKKPYYEEVITALKAPAASTLVCGDRIAIDLTPAKQLGFITVHMSAGRGEGATGPQGDVDFTIKKLAQLKDIVGNYDKQNSH